MERHIPLDDRDRRTLLDLAIHTIASGLERRPVPRGRRHSRFAAPSKLSAPAS